MSLGNQLVTILLPACYLSTYCLVASSERLHPSLSAVATLALALDLHTYLFLILDCSSPWDFRSSSLSSAFRCRENGYYHCCGLLRGYGLWISIFCISFLGSVVSSSMAVVFLVLFFHPAIWSWEFVWGCYSERYLFFFVPFVHLPCFTSVH